VSTAVTVIGNELAIGLQVVIEFAERACQLALLGTFQNTLVVLDKLDQCVDTLQTLLDGTVPQNPLRALQEP
jgi:hypothetical protein